MKEFNNFIYVSISEKYYDFFVSYCPTALLNLKIGSNKPDPFNRIVKLKTSKLINESEIFVSFFDPKKSIISLELGIAASFSKRIIVCLDKADEEKLPIFMDVHLKKVFIQPKRKFLSAGYLISTIQEQLLAGNDNPLLAKSPSKLVLISVGVNYDNIEKEFLFTSQFIGLIKEITRTTNIELISVTKGSLKSILKLDLNSWAKLLEKIIFIIQEIKRRKAEVFKITAETEKILAEIDKTKVETKKLEIETNIQTEHAIIDLFERYRNLGFNIQLDSELLLSVKRTGEISIQKPNSN